MAREIVIAKANAQLGEPARNTLRHFSQHPLTYRPIAVDLRKTIEQAG